MGKSVMKVGCHSVGSTSVSKMSFQMVDAVERQRASQMQAPERVPLEGRRPERVGVRVGSDHRSLERVRQRLEERQPRPRGREPDRLALVRQLLAPEQSSGPRSSEQLLRQLHQVVVVGVGLIELQHGELGIVLGRDALVPEVAVDLVHALEPADQQPLEIELGRDRAGRAACPARCDGSERAAPPLPRGSAASSASRPRGSRGRRRTRRSAAMRRLRSTKVSRTLRIDHEVHVALSVARLDVLQAVPLLRQRAQRLGEELEVLDGHRQLALARPEQLAGRRRRNPPRRGR